MRYIGCKSNLLSHIESCIAENVPKNAKTFCDIFSGTATVARHFKGEYEIISNDSLYFSYAIQKTFIESNEQPTFERLKNRVADPISFLENSKIEILENQFIAQNYSPLGNEGRMYFTAENACRIDFVRGTIEKWKNGGDLSECEYYYLLASLIEAVPSVSNITGTYGAYLKNWDKRAFKNLKLPQLEICDNKKRNRAYNEDVFSLLPRISGDILYIDPPYNTRQYASNYHILETVARYDNPKISGVTGMRPCECQKSPFCSKSEVCDAFERLIKNANFSHILVSYNSAGLMSEEFITKMLKQNGNASTFGLKKIPYRKYKSKIYDEKEVFEYIFYIQKKMPCSTFSVPNSDKAKYIKSPLNYIGGKYKLLPQILPLFPKNIETFVDLFCGGGNVGINADCKNLIFNDINSILVGMLSAFANLDIETLLEKIDKTIAKWQLSETNEKGFLKFRSHYNQTRNPVDLYVLSCFSFNYQIRFNENHDYNNPFGRNRSKFSETMRGNLVRFVKKLQESRAKFFSRSFENFSASSLTKSDFVYCDPPYLITKGTYNDGKRGFENWTEKSERMLYDFLDELDGRGVRFALSNVFEHKGKKNEILQDWSKKYNVVHLQKSYANSCYNTKRQASDEVLVANYECGEKK